MIHVWNIYETGDPDCLSPDPFDIFLYALRREEEPHYNDCLYVEGRRCKVIAVKEDFQRNAVLSTEGERYWKVCITNNV